MRVRLLIAVVCLAGLTMFTKAQTWSEEQLDVWKTIQAEWEAGKAKDSDRLDRLLHEKFLGWGNETPTPRNKTSTKMWDRYYSENNTTLIQELYPLGIVVHKDTAVAHYVYSQATEDSDGKRETVNGRYTDVLIKEDGRWQFLSWSGGEIEPADD